MSPSEAIAMLDAQLAEHGQDVVLQRLSAGAVAQAVTVRAFVREDAADDLVNGVMQRVALVTISPTGAASFLSGAETGLDARIPIKGNRLMISGRARTVQAAEGRKVGGTVARIEIRVLG